MTLLASIIVSFGLGVGFSGRVKGGMSTLWAMVKSDASAKLAQVETKIKEKV